MHNRLARTRLKKHLVLSLYILVAAVLCSPARARDSSTWPTKGWLTSAPEEQGMDSSALARLVAFGGSHSLDGLLVVRRGRIVLDVCYAPYTADIPHEIFSSTKAVTGTLLGMVYKDGLLDRLDHPMLDFFAGRHVANVDDRKKAITVQNLLDMMSGLDWDQGFESGKEQLTHLGFSEVSPHQVRLFQGFAMRYNVLALIAGATSPFDTTRSRPQPR